MASDKPNYPSDAAEKFIIRFPPGMRERIAEAAKASNRSMNAEIIERLQRSLGQVERQFLEDESRLMEAIAIQRLDNLRAQWRSERVRVEMLRERITSLRSANAAADEVQAAENELFVSEVDLKELEDAGRVAAEEVKRLARR